MSFSWAGRPCLVTGGAGFGGSHLCASLLGREAKVYVLDRLLPRNSYLILQGISNQIEFIPGDIRNLDLMRLTLERYQIDTVFHLAAQPIAPMSNVLPFETLSVNAMGTYTVLEAMRTTTCTKRMVFASSGAYYGTTTTDKPINEDDAPAAASNIYAPSKVAGDVAVRAYAQIYGIKAAVCRFMNTYGPGDANFSRIVPRAIRNLMQQGPYEFGDRDDGSTRLDYLHIRDMANAYIKLAENLDVASGEAFNFGRGQPVSTSEMTSLISRLFDGRAREPLFMGAKREKPVVKYMDIAKAARVLGWQPTTTLEQGLGETVDWYRKFLGQL
jgi:nucleoside-diphosphate-sugar epimerase